jgi:alkaline phosphatase
MTAFFIALYSANFKTYSSWNGEGDIIEKEKIQLENIIDSVHSQKKKIRSGTRQMM